MDSTLYEFLRSKSHRSFHLGEVSNLQTVSWLIVEMQDKALCLPCCGPGYMVMKEEQKATSAGLQETRSAADGSLASQHVPAVAQADLRLIHAVDVEMRHLHMSIFTLRERRISTALPVEVYLQSRHGTWNSLESSCGILSSLSKNGGCIICSKVILDGEHVFFTTQKDADNFIHLTALPEECPVSSLFATGIWMDSCVYEQRPSFKIGMHFLHEQKQLFAYLCRHRR